MTPDMLFEDKPLSIPIPGGSWQPKNYTHEYLGEMTMREALMRSVNSIAVQISEQAGRNHVIDVARKLGITSDLEPVPSLALGATEVSLVEMTTAYAHLAANGKSVLPHGILEIKTSKGESLYKRTGELSARALNESIAGMMNSMLMSVVTGGTGTGANIGRPAAGKTGTTSNYRDAWFIGFTPDLVAGVWVGNDDGLHMKKVTGGTLPAAIWRGFMKPAHEGIPVKAIPTASGHWGWLPWNSPDDTAANVPSSQTSHEQPAEDSISPELWEELKNSEP
jgi:penicillin-binding protein 1A